MYVVVVSNSDIDIGGGGPVVFDFMVDEAAGDKTAVAESSDAGSVFGLSWLLHFIIWYCCCIQQWRR